MSINVSPGGVPKLPVPSADVGPEGLTGDGHRSSNHGGPDHAVLLFGLDVIERLRAEGHPIGPGTAGENLTLTGVDWANVVPGTRLIFAGGVELEATGYCTPCAKIAGSFKDGDGNRLLHDRHPGDSRVHTRVLKPGRLTAGETFRLA